MIVHGILVALSAASAPLSYRTVVRVKRQTCADRGPAQGNLRRQLKYEPHPFCPPGTGNSVYSGPEMSTPLRGVKAAGILLATARVQTCPNTSGIAASGQKIFANETLYQ